MLTLLSSVTAAALNLDATLSPEGKVAINVKGQTWIQSTNPPAFFVDGKWCVVGADCKATPLGSSGLKVTNADESFVAELHMKSGGDEEWVEFETIFVTGAKNTASGKTDDVSSTFPSFGLVPSKVDLGTLGWGGTFINNGVHGPKIGKWPTDLDTGNAGGPNGLFNGDDCIIVSASNNFMGQTHASQNLSFTVGVMGSVEEIPAGHTVSTIVSYGSNGINNAVTKWGSTLLNKFGKTTAVRDADYMTKWLGFNTDHGAYYYYHTEDKMNYHDTLVAVQKKAEAEGIPLKFVLLDSWWYFKGTGGGVANWTVRGDIFPPGGDGALKQFSDETQWPIIGHNRYWSNNTPYAKANGGDFDFSDGSSNAMVVPLHQEFWDFLLGKSKAWGLYTYEQDWLYNEFNGVPLLTKNATMARTWLMQMGAAAEKHNLTIQYCMAYPRHALQSIEIQHVSQIRASDDYVPGHNNPPPNWNLGGSSMLAHAIALAPFKDNFWTSHQEPGGSCGNTTEPDVERHAAVATLSTGPVTVGDGIAYFNKSLIMKSCRPDGLLLKPDRPATYMDSYIQEVSAGTANGSMWSTYTTVSGYRFNIVFATEMTAMRTVVPSQLSLDSPPNQPTQVQYTSEGVASEFSESSPIKIKSQDVNYDIQLFYTAPRLSNNVAVLGEVGPSGKWVPVSSQRFSKIEVKDSTACVTLNGVVGEKTSIYFTGGSVDVTFDTAQKVVCHN
eukprot:TRINITY_DN694_c0_g1_i1.p1 TRINITY_DN694_c0_g1~~TRINITY_DN694_c0_g1_i1.p1  ORF type:complete len:723 (+),score=190.92 TRINITY_DN694_c0_g1_i1:41-2209(+)